MTGYTVTGPCNTRRRPCTQVSRDGLYDEDLRFGVEFNKEPRIIDDAVYYAVNFMEIRGLIEATDKVGTGHGEPTTPTNTAPVMTTPRLIG